MVLQNKALSKSSFITSFEKTIISLKNNIKIVVFLELLAIVYLKPPSLSNISILAIASEEFIKLNYFCIIHYSYLIKLNFFAPHKIKTFIK